VSYKPAKETSNRRCSICAHAVALPEVRAAILERLRQDHVGEQTSPEARGTECPPSVLHGPRCDQDCSHWRKSCGSNRTILQPLQPCERFRNQPFLRHRLCSTCGVWATYPGRQRPLNSTCSKSRILEGSFGWFGLLSAESRRDFSWCVVGRTRPSSVSVSTGCANDCRLDQTRAPTFDHVLPHSRGATSPSDSQSVQIARVLRLRPAFIYPMLSR
jgi:hypothetical protein